MHAAMLSDHDGKAVQSRHKPSRLFMTISTPSSTIQLLP